MNLQQLVTSQLHDIVTPPPVSWWPLAPGWWLLFAAVLLASTIASHHMWHAYKRHRQRQQLLNELSELQLQYQEQPLQYLQKLSQFLRAIAINFYGREIIARLTNRQWLLFLSRVTGCDDFQGPAGQLLLQQPYQADDTSNIEQMIPVLNAMLKLWIKKLPPSKQQLNHAVGGDLC